jgi:putative addiction module killer protein
VESAIGQIAQTIGGDGGARRIPQQPFQAHPVASLNRYFGVYTEAGDHGGTGRFEGIQIEQGNLSNAKRVGSGVHEYRIDFGPGDRVYFGRDGDRLVILLGGGTKKRQEKDIRVAQAYWADYKRRKKLETE